MLAGAMALMALTAGPAAAQGRGHGHRGDKGMPPGQAKKAAREEAAQFNDRGRELARNWYIHERRDGREGGAEAERRGGPPGRGARGLPPGLRDRDRLPPGIERQLRRGWVVERDYRPRLYEPPVALVRVLGPPPPGCRYFLFGGNVILVDSGYRVFDVINLELNLRF
jgi:hypothetical protein